MMIRAVAIAMMISTPGALAASRDTVVRQGAPRAPLAKEVAKPAPANRAPTPKGWYEAGLAAIRAKNPGRAVEMMKPLLADFEKRYSGEKRHMFCAVNASQAKAYLSDAAVQKLDAVTIEPDWCRAQYIRGYALIDLGKTDDALAAFQRLTELAPKNSRYLNELGFVFADTKKYQQAVDAYQRSLAVANLSPDDTDQERCVAYRGIGYNMAKLGKLDDAEAAYRNCLAIDVDNDEVQDALDDLDEQRKQTV
jgi:tetratricopeptide (TPR) repeat protein